LNFNLLTPRRSRRESSPRKWQKIDRFVDVDLGPELRSAGVNAAAIKAKSASGFSCSSKSANDCLQQIRNTGYFGTIASAVEIDNTNISVTAAGTLSYSWRDSAGNQHSRSSPFRIKLPLGHVTFEAECGEGGETDRIASKPISFKLNQNSYRLPISFQRTILASRISRFAVTVDASKASKHDFNFVLQLADGREVSSRPVKLIYYLPSWFNL
jgi:hypothetical protein